MTNDEAIRLIKSGDVAEWNTYRDQHPQWYPILHGVYLANTSLPEINLRRADIDMCDFEGATLAGARFNFGTITSSKFDRAYLQYTDWTRASFLNNSCIEANFRSANLTQVHCFTGSFDRADLSEAYLWGTIFDHVSLDGTDFSNAELTNLAFISVDVSKTRNLKQQIPPRPIRIAVDTLIRSKGQIPKKLLQGAGMPPQWIEYLPSLINDLDPIQFYSCFISHSSKDSGFCEQLHKRLSDDGLRVWYAPADMRGGRKSHEQLEAAIRLYDKLLLVLSEDSISSEWVKSEIRWALEKERTTGKRVLFPIRLVDIATLKRWKCFDADTGRDMAVEVREYHIPDFSNWRNKDSFEKAYQRLLDDLKAEDENHAEAG